MSRAPTPPPTGGGWAPSPPRPTALYNDNDDNNKKNQNNNHNEKNNNSKINNTNNSQLDTESLSWLKFALDKNAFNEHLNQLKQGNDVHPSGKELLQAFMSSINISALSSSESKTNEIKDNNINNNTNNDDNRDNNQKPKTKTKTSAQQKADIMYELGSRVCIALQFNLHDVIDTVDTVHQRRLLMAMIQSASSDHKRFYEMLLHQWVVRGAVSGVSKDILFNPPYNSSNVQSSEISPTASAVRFLESCLTQLNTRDILPSWVSTEESELSIRWDLGKYYFAMDDFSKALQHLSIIQNTHSSKLPKSIKSSGVDCMITACRYALHEYQPDQNTSKSDRLFYDVEDAFHNILSSGITAVTDENEHYRRFINGLVFDNIHGLLSNEYRHNLEIECSRIAAGSKIPSSGRGRGVFGESELMLCGRALEPVVMACNLIRGIIRNDAQREVLFEQEEKRVHLENTDVLMHLFTLSTETLSIASNENHSDAETVQNKLRKFIRSVCESHDSVYMWASLLSQGNVFSKDKDTERLKHCLEREFQIWSQEEHLEKLPNQMQQLVRPMIHELQQALHASSLKHDTSSSSLSNSRKRKFNHQNLEDQFRVLSGDCVHVSKKPRLLDGNKAAVHSMLRVASSLINRNQYQLADDIYSNLDSNIVESDSNIPQNIDENAPEESPEVKHERISLDGNSAACLQLGRSTAWLKQGIQSQDSRFDTLFRMIDGKLPEQKQNQSKKPTTIFNSPLSASQIEDFVLALIEKDEWKFLRSLTRHLKGSAGPHGSAEEIVNFTMNLENVFFGARYLISEDPRFKKPKFPVLQRVDELLKSILSPISSSSSSSSHSKNDQNHRYASNERLYVRMNVVHLLQSVNNITLLKTLVSLIAVALKRIRSSIKRKRFQELEEREKHIQQQYQEKSKGRRKRKKRRNQIFQQQQQQIESEKNAVSSLPDVRLEHFGKLALAFDENEKDYEQEHEIQHAQNEHETSIIYILNILLQRILELDNRLYHHSYRELPRSELRPEERESSSIPIETDTWYAWGYGDTCFERNEYRNALKYYLEAGGVPAMHTVTSQRRGSFLSFPQSVLERMIQALEQIGEYTAACVMEQYVEISQKERVERVKNLSSIDPMWVRFFWDISCLEYLVHAAKSQQDSETEKLVIQMIQRPGINAHNSYDKRQQFIDSIKCSFFDFLYNYLL